MPSALAGRRILITRTRSQASELARALADVGATPLLVPVIEIAPPSSFAALDAALGSLDSFDWLVFTSANAVSAVAARALHLGISVRARRIAAIGPASAQALHAASIVPVRDPVLVPPVAVAESLADSLLRHLPAGGASVAILRAEAARDILPQTLTAAGVDVHIIPVYRTVPPLAAAAELQALFADPARAPEAVTFTSSSTATNLVALLQGSGVTLPVFLRRVSIGPVTSATLRDLGLPPHTEARTATIPAMLEAILDAFTQQPAATSPA